MKSYVHQLLKHSQPYTFASLFYLYLPRLFPHRLWIVKQEIVISPEEDCETSTPKISRLDRERDDIYQS